MSGWGNDYAPPPGWQSDSFTDGMPERREPSGNGSSSNNDSSIEPGPSSFTVAFLFWGVLILVLGYYLREPTPEETGQTHLAVFRESSEYSREYREAVLYVEFRPDLRSEALVIMKSRADKILSEITFTVTDLRQNSDLPHREKLKLASEVEGYYSRLWELLNYIRFLENRNSNAKEEEEEKYSELADRYLDLRDEAYFYRYGLELSSE